ncbi:MAG: hypothetical protein HFJ98_09720 [Eubacterium sp.]|nr:hypothetical protein [Eubacterium sp.]
MKKNKRVIIITIIAIIVIITGIIVGISINNHNTAVKEALSVSESKQSVCDSFDEEYKSVVDKEHKTVEDYSSAKDALIAIKDNINKSDIKDDERLISLISNIDKTIEEYDVKVKELTTTTTESTTEVTTEATTEKEDKPVNATTPKSNSSNNSTTKSNNTTKATPKVTQPKTTAKQTTTKKSYDPDPAYGTVKFSYPNGNYKVNHWSAAGVYWIWDGEQWNANINISGGMHTPCNKDDFINRCIKAFPKPSKDGKNVGEKVMKNVWIWN